MGGSTAPDRHFGDAARLALTSVAGQSGRVSTVLVTGSSGQVGRPLVERLREAGFFVQPFDLDAGQDLRDESAVLASAAGCDAIVHAGAIAHDSAGTPADIIATNVLGTAHVLLAAESVGARRVVYLSSGQVFGFADGEGTPEQLPVTDDDPLRAARPYGLSKRSAEDLCLAWTVRTGITTVVLRPVLILSEESLAHTHPRDVELSAFVHVDDVIDAIVRALERDPVGHHRLTLCGPGPFDTSRAADLLDWAATRGWP